VLSDRTRCVSSSYLEQVCGWETVTPGPALSNKTFVELCTVTAHSCSVFPVSERRHGSNSYA